MIATMTRLLLTTFCARLSRVLDLIEVLLEKCLRPPKLPSILVLKKACLLVLEVPIPMEVVVLMRSLLW